MIDSKYKVRRFIAEYSDTTDELLEKYKLSDFELKLFQKEFLKSSLDNPMFDCYQIAEKNIIFLKNYIQNEPDWNFSENSYFLEAVALGEFK